MELLIDNESASQQLEVHAARIRSSGILARSTHLHSLFEYLYQCYLTNKIPKELEIAIEGLGREENFDVTQDALVRVYMHKLRRKLDDFYDDEGKSFSHRLQLPKGEYRFILQPQENIPDTINSAATNPALPGVRITRGFMGGIIATLLLINLALLYFWPAPTNLNQVRDSILWQPLLADNKPTLLVVGDYYIFAESDNGSNVNRLVRDFDINSPIDLASYLQLYPEQAEHKFDISLSYLPTSSAQALNKISPIINNARHPVQTVMASQLTAEQLRNNNIVYIGHLSGLGLLSDQVFAHSHFAVGDGGFDELVDKETGTRYINARGIPGAPANTQQHYAYLSSFTGPADNRFVIVAGLRDAGLIELANIVSDGGSLKSITEKNSSPFFEAVYQANAVGQNIGTAQPVSIKSLPLAK
ncbi:MAG: hypothetical protein B0W54_02900 [Cellvibrio sp. 79]|nr:MAG: hypothetical protein B0W54_02900 [Cellvibrio sp. 79]